MSGHGTILVTGSSGLIGDCLCRSLSEVGLEVRRFDLKACGADQGDIRDRESVRRAVTGSTGVIHLAAVSRVVQAERDPAACWETNVVGLSTLIEEAEQCQVPPWLVFASSREVYGHALAFPVKEDAPLRPVNSYGRSKVEGERLTGAAAAGGLRTSVVRLSNVYGSIHDHRDRVVPAFALAAATGGHLRVEGGKSAFDFTHLDDTVGGLIAIVKMLSSRRDASLPPIQFVTGQATTLEQLAKLAIRMGNREARAVRAAPRSFDVSHFCGSPMRAKEMLGWQAKVSLEEGLKRLIDDFGPQGSRVSPIAGPQ